MAINLMLLLLQGVGILCDNVLVSIDSGRVLGTANNTTPNGNSYYSFKGIRYGRIPARFEDAIGIEKWNGTYNATVDGPICIQKQTGVPQSEDCLFVSVYTTKLLADDEEKLPVMFWVYGGSFTSGDSRFESYNPEYLLDEDVVVVTLNYRVGMFGFISSGDDQIPGNNGIKDVILGLKWVKRNIAAFGGDPNQVTIFGESAGAAIISYLQISPLVKGKGYFVRAIQESGDVLMPWALQRQPKNIYKQALVLTKCSKASNPLSCIKNVTTKAIFDAQTLILAGDGLLQLSALNGIGYAPVYESPSEKAAVVNGSYTRLQDSYLIDIPVLAGINSEEGLLFEHLLPLMRIAITQADLNNSLLVPEDLHASVENIKKFIRPKLRSYYFGKSPLISLSPAKDVIRYISDTMFNKPWRENLNRIKNLVTTHCYMFSYVGAPSKNHKNYKDPRMGMVGHSEELNYIWKDYNNLTLSKDDLVIKSKMVKMWTNFAKTGNPTPNTGDDGDVLSGVFWERTSGNNTDVRCMNINNTLEMIDNPKEEQFQMWKKYYDTYGNPYDTY